MWQKVASGGFIDLKNLKDYEGAFQEGQQGRLDIDLRYTIPQSVAGELENRLRQSGVEDVKVVTGSPRLSVVWRKGFAWLAVIAATILAIVVLAILILGWTMFREVVPETLQPLIGTVGLLVVLAVLAALAWNSSKMR